MRSCGLCFILVGLALPGSVLLAQAPDSSHHHDPSHHAAAPDTAFAAMQQRGKKAMNVDQNMAHHRFTSMPDGGQIELTSDVADTAAVNGIRRHIAEIQQAFSTGDFSTPAFVHMQKVPGTATMAERKALITYKAIEISRGARLRLTTRDPEALKAIHQFMEFQRTEHRAGQ